MIDQYCAVKSCYSFKEYLSVLQEQYSDRVAFESMEAQWQYIGLVRSVLSLQNRFRGVKELIGLDIESPVEFTVALLAVITSGNVAVLLDENRLDGQISCDQILTHDWLDGNWLPDENLSIAVSDLPNLDAWELAVIAPSSGTTSEHKYVMLSQRNILDVIVSVKRCGLFFADETYLAVMPHSHLFGVLADILIPLYSGAKIFFPNNKYSFFFDLSKYAPTSLNIPPVLVEQLDKRIQKGESARELVGPNLNRIISGGAYLDDTIIQRFKNLGIDIYIAYGLTECAPCISINSKLASRRRSVGRILPCCKVKIVDGEIAVRGSNVMLGYYGDPEATRRVLKDGWLFTGDMGRLEDGFLYLTGRRSNLIVFEDALKLLPESLEKAIDGIIGVQESLVVAKTTDGHTKLYITVSVTPEGEASTILPKVNEKCREANVISKVGDIQFTAQRLPRTALGKLIRVKNEIHGAL